MRIAGLWEPNANANYRAIDPLRAMKRRGHDVVLVEPEERIDLKTLMTCDLVHVYRRMDDRMWHAAGELLARGIAVTYDNDDDVSARPKQSPQQREFGGYRGELLFRGTVRMAKRARATSTTSEVLAAKYRRAGVEGIRVIANALSPDLRRPRASHRGVVIGWIAGNEHQADVQPLKLVQTLEQVLDAHDEVSVECVGVDLGLSQRYRHDRHVPFEDLPRRIAGFDIGIAPLADIPWNWSRSDIKVKEYAASGVPWLASPIGPYKDLGPDEGGLLVPDGGWVEALERLVSSKRERRKLARKAKRWAKTQTLDAYADRWERMFLEAAGAQ